MIPRFLKRSALLALFVLLCGVVLVPTPALAYDVVGDVSSCFDAELTAPTGFAPASIGGQEGVWHLLLSFYTPGVQPTQIQAWVAGDTAAYYSKITLKASGKVVIKVANSTLVDALDLHCLNAELTESLGHIAITGILPASVTALQIDGKERLVNYVEAADVVWDNPNSRFVLRGSVFKLTFARFVLPADCTLEFREGETLVEAFNVSIPAITPTALLKKVKLELDKRWNTIVITGCVTAGANILQGETYEVVIE